MNWNRERELTTVRMLCFTSSPPITQKQTEISETHAAHSAQEQVYPFLLTPAVYLSKAFTVLLLPSFTASPPPPVVEPIHNCRPPIAACQMPASDIVHHCAGVSGANCHLFFFLVLLMRRGSGEKKSPQRTWGGEIRPKLSGCARNH